MLPELYPDESMEQVRAMCVTQTQPRRDANVVTPCDDAARASLAQTRDTETSRFVTRTRPPSDISAQARGLRLPSLGVVCYTRNPAGNDLAQRRGVMFMSRQAGAGICAVTRAGIGTISFEVRGLPRPPAGAAGAGQAAQQSGARPPPQPHPLPHPLRRPRQGRCAAHPPLLRFGHPLTCRLSRAGLLVCVACLFGIDAATSRRLDQWRSDAWSLLRSGG
eukprot:1183965-Prorocentrum_minimum.AAC.3